jgi:hypothetical protein
MPDDTELDRLTGYIAASRRVQRRVLAIAAATLVIGVAVAFVHRPIGLGLALLAVLVAGSGLWITTGHILEWRGKLRQLERRRGRGGTDERIHR